MVFFEPSTCCCFIHVLNIMMYICGMVKILMHALRGCINSSENLADWGYVFSMAEKCVYHCICWSLVLLKEMSSQICHITCHEVPFWMSLLFVYTSASVFMFLVLLTILQLFIPFHCISFSSSKKGNWLEQKLLFWSPSILTSTNFSLGKLQAWLFFQICLFQCFPLWPFPFKSQMFFICIYFFSQWSLLMHIWSTMHTVFWILILKIWLLKLNKLIPEWHNFSGLLSLPLKFAKACSSIVAAPLVSM